mgnify:CR=1 FL=1
MPEELSEFLTAVPKELPFVIGSGIMTVGARLILYGTRKNFKSQMCRHLLFCIAQGKPFFGYQVNQKRVLLIDLETPSKDELKMLLKAYIDGHVVQLPKGQFFVEHLFHVSLDTDYGLDWLIKRIKACEPEVVAIDPLYKGLSSVGKTQIERMIYNVDHVRQMFPGTCFIITHHTRKERTDPDGNVIDGGLDELLDSVLLSAWVDTAIKIRRLTEQGTEATLSFTALKSASRELLPIRLNFEPLTMGFSNGVHP